MASADLHPPRFSGDRLVGTPSHPIAAGIGAITAAAAGAVVGSAGGPVGTVVGAMVGAFIGGLGSDAIASAVGEAQDAGDWRVDNGAVPGYADRARLQQRLVVSDRDVDAQAFELGEDSSALRGNSGTTWEDAEPAIRDAWVRRQARLHSLAR